MKTVSEQTIVTKVKELFEKMGVTKCGMTPETGVIPIFL